MTVPLYGGRLVRKPAVPRPSRLAATAIMSSAVSVLIAILANGRPSSAASYALFVGVAGFVSLAVGRDLGRTFDAGLVFVFFLFEPIGRVLLHQQTAPKDIFLALAVGLVVAYFFGQEGGAGTVRGSKSL